MEIMGFNISDDVVGIVLPVLVYWSYSGILTLFEPLLHNYRLHSKKDEDEKNLVTKVAAIKGVLFSQAIQMAVYTTIYIVVGSDVDDSNRENSLFSSLKQILIATMVLDTWLYFVHRYMHHNKFLYQHFHAYHHRLLVPYAFGAMYTHPIEGLITDTMGGALSLLISGMSARVSMFVFSFSIVKTINDHCGLLIPGNPFDIFLENSTAYHDSHHQLNGTKYNFSSTYFVFWDRLLGTYKPCSLEKKKTSEGIKSS